MARYGVGIIGAGWVAGEYVRIFANHPKTELVGVYNRTPGKATDLCESLGAEAREYASLDELFDDERIQIIASCTHPDTRREHCVRAAETGRSSRGTYVACHRSHVEHRTQRSHASS